MSRLTRDGTAEPVSGDQILRHARRQGNIHFPCSADHEQDWQPYPVDPYSAICYDHTYSHAAINLQPPSHTVLYHTPGSSAAVLQSPMMSNTRRSSATQSVHHLSFSPGPRSPAFSSSSNMTLSGNLWSLMRSRAPDHINLLVRKVASTLSHPIRWRTSLSQRMQLFSDLHQAPGIRSNILSYVVRSLL